MQSLLTATVVVVVVVVVVVGDTLECVRSSSMRHWQL
jgi:hypothetical protein